MKLYHYTTFSNFCSIWIQQKLNFSEWTNSNDVYEREKSFLFTLTSRVFNGKKCPPEIFRKFTSEVFEEIKRYKQISFCMDYSGGIDGYASPMMWGHYARDYQRSGVCIEFDSTKIELPKQFKIYRGKVKYNRTLTPTHVGGVDAEKADAAQKYVVNNRNKLFFTKYKHWQYENEYRFISKDCPSLEVSNSITSVYVLGGDNVTLQSVKRIIMDTERIAFLNVGGIKTLKLNQINPYVYEAIKKEVDDLTENRLRGTE